MGETRGYLLVYSRHIARDVEENSSQSQSEDKNDPKTALPHLPEKFASILRVRLLGEGNCHEYDKKRASSF